MPRLANRWSRRSIFSALVFLALILWSSADASAQFLDSPGRIWTLHGEISYCPDPRQRVSLALIYDVQTGTELQSYGFGDANGNYGQIVTGLAFDTTHRSIWYTLIIPSCAGGPAMGDGFIYSRPAAALGPITALPVAGGVGVRAFPLWNMILKKMLSGLPSLRPKTVKASSIKSTPAVEPCSKPFRFLPRSATWAFHNQTTHLR